MEFSSKSLTSILTPPLAAPPGESSVAAFPRKVLQGVLWSPLYLLTAIIHVLTRRLTKKALFGVTLLDIPLQWGTHLALRPNAAAMGAIEGFDVSITTIALVGLYIGWLFTERASHRWPRIVWNWPIMAYTSVVIASIFVASDIQLSLFQIFLMVQLLLFYIYAAGNIKSREEIAFVLYFLLAGGIVESAYMIIVAATGRDFAFVRALGMKTVIFRPDFPGEFTRPGGTVGGPNYAAAYLAILIVLALSVRRMDVPSALRWLTIPVLILAPIGLAITFSRGGWLEVLFSVMILAGATWLRQGVSWKSALSAVAVLALISLCLFTSNPISERLSANDNGSAHSRIPLMHLADNIISANPVLGVGANNFAAVMDDYEGSEFRHAWIYTVHNEFLLVGSETGVLGLAAYLWIYFSLIRRGWRLWKVQDAMFAPLGLGMVAAICGLLSHMFVDIFSDRPLLQLLWLFVALLGACEMIQWRDAGEQNPLQGIKVKP